MTQPLSAQQMQFDVPRRSESHDREDDAFLCPNPDAGQADFCILEGTCQTRKCTGEEFLW